MYNNADAFLRLSYLMVAIGPEDSNMLILISSINIAHQTSSHVS